MFLCFDFGSDLEIIISFFSQHSYYWYDFQSPHNQWNKLRNIHEPKRITIALQTNQLYEDPNHSSMTAKETKWEPKATRIQEVYQQCNFIPNKQ